MINTKITCLDINCPERRGDACQFDLEGTRENLIRDMTAVNPLPMAKSEAKQRLIKLIAAELRQVRSAYEVMEYQSGDDTMENPSRKFVTWRGWKMIRNVISDRIEQLTGERV